MIARTGGLAALKADTVDSIDQDHARFVAGCRTDGTIAEQRRMH